MFGLPLLSAGPVAGGAEQSGQPFHVLHRHAAREPGEGLADRVRRKRLAIVTEEGGRRDAECGADTLDRPE